jgi:hypothetical protein
MRNWTSTPAFRIARFLFCYRLVGVVAFELLDSRLMLLVFPNTFEFFFIAYEGLRTRWDPERWSGRFWLYVAGGIWVFVKLPQEYWIHVCEARLHRRRGRPSVVRRALPARAGRARVPGLVRGATADARAAPRAGASPNQQSRRRRRGARRACRGASWPRSRSC